MKNKLKKLLSVILAVAIATAGIQLSNLEVHAASYAYTYDAAMQGFDLGGATMMYGFTLNAGDTWKLIHINSVGYTHGSAGSAGHIINIAVERYYMVTDGSGYHPTKSDFYCMHQFTHAGCSGEGCTDSFGIGGDLPSDRQYQFTADKDYEIEVYSELCGPNLCRILLASQEYLDYVAAGGDPAGGVPTAGTSHNHTYKWEIIQKGSPETDQIETQICSSCGAKGSTKTTPAYTFFLTDAKNTLSAKTTPAGGTVSLTSKTINVFSKSLMEEIAKRKDVNVVLTYKYDGKNVQVTIPAGTAIDTTCDYYGPVKMMSLYGYKLLDTFPGEIKASSIAEINDAVKGATVTLKGKNSYNVSDMLAISNRRDINVDLEVAYSGKTYVIHIPAGATVDVNSEWYGPLKLMSLYSFTTK